MIDFIKKYWLILVALAAILLAIMTFLIQKNKGTNISVGQTPTGVPVLIPTITLKPTVETSTASIGFGPNPSNSPEIIKQQSDDLQQNQSDYPLANKLPYKGTNFTIDHYYGPKELVVNISAGADKSAITVAINKWLQGNGFTADSHTIRWVENSQ